MKIYLSDVELTWDHIAQGPEAHFSYFTRFIASFYQTGIITKENTKVLKLHFDFCCFENNTSDILCRFQTWVFCIVDAWL
jgi:hypothetical protein